MSNQDSERTLFDREGFVALLRARHPERRLATAAARLRVRELDHQPDATKAWVFGAYATIIGRLPDSAGLTAHENFLRGGGTPAELVASMSASGEARDNNTGAAAELDDVFITGAYLLALGRRPDPAGVVAQRAALAAGFDHTDVMDSLLRSPEAQAQLRFPPAPLSPDKQLARSVQEVVSGHFDPQIDRLLALAAREGRSVSWMVRTALRLRGGRREMLRALPRLPWLSHLARRRAATTSVLASLEASDAWNWRIHRKLMNDVSELSREVAELRSQAATR